MKSKILFVQLLLLVIFTTKNIIPQVEFESSNLPICIIDTDSQTIVNDERIIAKMRIIYNEEDELNNISDSVYDYNGNIAIEIRGSSSLQYPKKSYRIETQDSNGENYNVSLLGMPKENDWVLHAPYSDKTLIRNVLSYQLANNMGHYASRTKFCELILNNEYQGIYVLMEKVKKDKNRVDIAELGMEDSLGDDITGGYIIKIDKTSGENNDGWETEKVFYQYHYPKPDTITDKQKSYIQSYIANFEEVFVKISNNDTVADPYEFYDINSFVDYFLVNELCRNIDGYRLSVYMYKDKDSKNGKLTMGPIWDFNISLGNANYYLGHNSEGWNLDLLLKNKQTNVPFWWKTLRNDPAFLNKLYYRWKELRDTIFHVDSLNYFINIQIEYLEEAQERNFNKWPILGVRIWPNWFVGNTFNEEIEFMKNWLSDRIDWLDDNIKLDSIVSVSKIENNSTDDLFILDQNYPNPFNPVTTINYSINPLSTKSSVVKLNVYNSLGEKVKTLVHKTQPKGNYNVKFDATDLPTGVYFYKLSFDNLSTIKKMIFLK